MSNQTRQAITAGATARLGLRMPQLTLALGCVLAGLSILSPARGEEPATGYVSPHDPANDYLDAIDRIEGDYGPYATELSDLYLGLGQTLLDSGDYERARDAFHRGVMVVRVNSGPNSPEQTNHLYLIANIEMLRGEAKAADEVLENIQFINSTYFGEDSPELLPVLDRIYQWYQMMRPPGSEFTRYADYERIIELTEDMVDVSEAVNGNTHPETAAAYRRLGEAQFQTVRYLMGETMTLTLDDYVAVSGGTLYTPGVVKVSVGEHYDNGRKAFRKYFEAMQANESTTPLEYAEALANLGDWYLLFEKTRASRNLYQEAYATLAQSEDYAELADSYMAHPKPAYFATPQPGLLEDLPADLGDLNLDISMTVTSFGDVRYVEVINAPEGLSEDSLRQIKQLIRETPFRPAIKGGEVVTTKEFIWRYEILPAGSAS